MLKDEVVQTSIEDVYTEVEKRTLALSYLIRNLFEAKSLDGCLDVAIKGLSMLGFFQSQINLLEDGYFVVKRNHMDKKYQFLLEKIWGRKFLGYKVDARSSFASHLLDSRIVTTADIKGTVNVKLEDIIREYLPREWGGSKRLGMVTRVVSVLPKKIDMLILPLNYRGRVIGGLGISSTSLELEDAFFLKNLCELFAQAFEKVQTREDLRKGEEKYRQLVESLYEGIWVIDEHAYTTFVNSRMAEMLGYTVDEMQGKHLFSFMDEQGVEICKRNLERRKQGVSEQHDFEFLRKDGTRVYTRLATSPLTDTEGNYVGAIAGVIDITERKKAEEELIRLSSAVKMSTDSIVISDLDAKIIDVNEATLKMYGTNDKRDLIGKNSFNLVVPEERERALAGTKEVLEKGYLKSREYHVITKDGSRIPVEMSVAIMKDADGEPIGFVGMSRDITERKGAEDRLRESREKFRSIFENATDCMIYLDKSGRILEVNRKAVEVFGGAKNELLGKHFTRLGVVSLKDIPRLLAAVAKGFAGKEVTLNVSIKNKRGQEIHLECSNSLTKTDGKLAGLLVIARDVTERRKAEEALTKSEVKYRNIVELAPDGIATMNMKGVVTSINTAFSRLTGYSKDEIVGKHFTKLGTLRAKDIPKYAKLISSIFRGKIPPHIEFAYLRKDGTQRWGEARLSLLEEGGKKVGIQAILRDVTERKQMDEKLRQYSERLEELVQKRTKELLESEKRYSVLVEEASDGVAIIQDGKIVFANKKASEIVDYSIDEAIGLPFEKFVDEKYLQHAIELYVGRLRGETVPATSELKVTAKTGERVPIEISGTLVNYQGSPAVLVILRDIRERKRIEEQRLKLEKLAAIGELATMVGHDLRNPLQSIENATYYLNNELPRLPPSIPNHKKTMEMLQIINNSVNYADKIIRDLQDFSATKKPTLQKTDINTIVKETLSQVKTPQNVELNTELGHLPEIKVDKDMIKRVFLNLAVNGIQAMQENGGRLVVSTRKTKDFVEVNFKDTGAGISKENIEKIFTPFFTTKAVGMGMGLAICKKFVENHSGRIEVESEEGKGSTFTVKLPIQPIDGGENQ